jgi:hypothetical protein
VPVSNKDASDDTVARSVLTVITDHYVCSGDFNGILADRLAGQLGLTKSSLLRILEQLLVCERIAIAFDRYQGNPHILRIPSPDTQHQLALVKSEALHTFCVYPSAKILTNHKDMGSFADKPFTRRLALGEAQLMPVFFDLSVLEAYYRDPRYHFQYGDMGGRIVITDKAYCSAEVDDRDKILLDTFGIGYDDCRNRVVIAYLRYLSILSPEHQQIWNAQVVSRRCQMNSDYERATLYGVRPKHHSAYRALLAEMEEINKLSNLINKPPLFHDDFSTGRPPGLHPMLRPTSRNLHEFVHLLDKILSENVNRDFFRNDIPLEKEDQRSDGKIQVVTLGTLTLLGNWLSKRYRTVDGEDVSGEIVGPLKQIRKLRQGPAHEINQDKFDILLPKQQDKLLIDALQALQKLRLVLMSHPAARDKYKPPDWLDGDKVVLY